MRASAALCLSDILMTFKSPYSFERFAENNQCALFKCLPVSRLQTSVRATALYSAHVNAAQISDYGHDTIQACTIATTLIRQSPNDGAEYLDNCLAFRINASSTYFHVAHGMFLQLLVHKQLTIRRVLYEREQVLDQWLLREDKREDTLANALFLV